MVIVIKMSKQKTECRMIISTGDADSRRGLNPQITRIREIRKAAGESCLALAYWLSAKGARCKSLGQRPKDQVQLRFASAESARSRQMSLFSFYYFAPLALRKLLLLGPRPLAWAITLRDLWRFTLFQSAFFSSSKSPTRLV